VPVCPTSANGEYAEAADLRRITSDMSLCVGCGTCVEVCPANLANGGQTLRVMEAPTRAFFNVLDDLDAQPTAETPATALPNAAAVAAGTAAGGNP
jgi:ferredoxin